MQIRSNVGTILSESAARPCGLCGSVRVLSKTHVPPQAAGNTGQVTRAADVIDINGSRRPGKARIGGMWVRGLCATCNSLAGARYDKAYADMHRQIARTSDRDISKLLLRHDDVPPVSIAPGLVARAVMFGMFAINTRLSIISPPLAEQVLNCEPHITMPGNMRLKLSRTYGHAALLTSGVFWARILNPKGGLHHFTFSDIVFPPLAWALVPDHDEPSATDRWADVTEWLEYSDDVTGIDLRLLLRHLPTSVHPRLAPYDGGWAELMSESVNVLGAIPA